MTVVTCSDLGMECVSSPRVLVAVVITPAGKLENWNF